MRTRVWVALLVCALFLWIPAPSFGGVTERGSPGGGTALTHVIEPGDTLWELARRYGTTVEAIAAANGIRPTQTLRIGQRLRIPTGRVQASTGASSRPGSRVVPSQVYTVRPGDSLWLIARRFGTTVEALMAANGLRTDRLQVGQRLRIPVPGRPAGTVAVRRRVGFLWPARGVLTSRFGSRWRRHHNGIDLAAPRGTPIYAARSGRVRYAGWYGGYGLLVVIDHGDGLETYYGHASRILVRPGQWVAQGQRIALVGCTGACTGSHLHFEVRVRGTPTDPLRYLR